MLCVYACYSRPNFLILDEPTNHLDVETVDALGRALKTFKVCMNIDYVILNLDCDANTVLCTKKLIFILRVELYWCHMTST